MPAMNIKNPTARYPKRIQTMARRKSRARNGMPGLPKKRRSATRKRYIILFRCGGRGPLLRLDRLDKQGNRRQTSATFFAPRKKQFMVGAEQGKVPPTRKIGSYDRRRPQSHAGFVEWRFSNRRRNNRGIRRASRCTGKFPELYRRVRIDTIQRDKAHDIDAFRRRLARLILNCEQGKMYGTWNDHGRLLSY